MRSTDIETRRGTQVALVTGAASGIGAAVASRLNEPGWNVAGLDLRESDTELSLIADVSDPEAVHAAVERVKRELGAVSLLVTVAGHYEMYPVSEIGPERWRRMLSVHLGGTRNACIAVLPDMLAAAHGTIITISSELALGGGANDAHYAAAKGAVIGFTKSLAVEVASRGVRVNSVAPGPTDTPLLDPNSPWRAADFLASLPLRRLVTPEEVAATVLFLAEEGDFFCGQVLSPNAGAVI
ncbi:Dehydrogenases with different specificities (related to short-chain alcohol dehydrogenases) (plasmid) [Rubrobacter radiotolerans]|uniref:Dehydrogenases with different specificities (Related to short-chain alcohol dehydrogenases) n=1 Tax=Rubrobacter radiotolerans TaxID=42256 RepID=A0A023X6Q0_RUBRA|nr:SDR family NAD(P)-dependent oxidoreductase [Rubrobacter radiotolerans]AHY48107.1 Dehydrogenases with different specificities (related to short-chain alcohol dehydrogenases) [Rubrobacter radiotolerans]MDX5895381.1 SDR family NAD(P)-dependent oxidoreductase [Rubrobacter radiotolerans]SMC01735.1 NAD(P)-dependent dehydrogenase, short-chain alcohol dehydrogenase family [Rubrobacter radiotolerans DSM 5868]